MSFDVHIIKRNPAFVRVELKGQPSLDQFISMLHLIGIESDAWAGRPVLFDLRGVRTHFTAAEHAQIGKEVAASMIHISRVASLVRPHRMTRAGEKVARRDGLDVRMFDLPEAAIDWLTSPPGSDPAPLDRQASSVSGAEPTSCS
ncbi:STAS/SEC14 domain-containing protein [Caenimonas sedimenti]|uniref:STAS/SEC14 domain-containing protein n=1 Tax=Caenimonas sedimenti TaxID=2596921 RepID=A0A562ZPC2_9BURK|nr:STAS/SEC14 domain-containing protein [Caenimonas sedimenti]TWO70410.1 STAS/SEC14 domain-containing protein [Caenimonas sedimenti]